MPGGPAFERAAFMSSIAILDETELFAALCGRARVRDEITMSFIAQDRGDIISFVATHAGLAQVAPSDAAVQAVCALVNRRHGIHLTNDDVTRVRQLAMSCFACYAAAQARQAIQHWVQPLLQLLLHQPLLCCPSPLTFVVRRLWPSANGSPTVWPYS